MAEGLTRNLEGFVRFINVAAAWSGRFLDMAKMALAAQMPRQTVMRFFEILEDCLLVKKIPAFAKSSSRRLLQHPKFYFFDVGVLNGLLGNFHVSEDRLGWLFEHFIGNMLENEASARDEMIQLSTFRTEHGAEVDYILEINRTIIALEIKARRMISRPDLRGLKNFGEYYGKPHRTMVLYLGDYRQEIDGVEIWPWQKGIKAIFD